MKHTLAVLAVFAFAWGGCATTNPASDGLEGVQFEDLPAAEGMKLEKPGYGFKTPSGNIREYNEYYVGTRKLETIKSFYEKAFPVHGWSLVTSEGTDPATLVFEKRAEKVIVTLKNAGDQLKVHVHTTGK